MATTPLRTGPQASKSPKPPAADDLSLEDFDVVPPPQRSAPEAKRPLSGLAMAAGRGDQPMLELPGLELDSLSLDPPAGAIDAGLSFSTGGSAAPAGLADSGLTFDLEAPVLNPGAPAAPAKITPPVQPVAPRPAPALQPPSDEPVVAFKEPSPPAEGDDLGLARPSQRPKEEPQPEPVKPVAAPPPRRIVSSRSRSGGSRTLIYALIVVAAAGTAGGLWWKHRMDVRREAREKLAKEIQKGRAVMNGDTPDRFKQASIIFDRVLRQKQDDLEAKVLAGEAALADALLKGGDQAEAGKGKRLVGEAQAAPPSTDLKRAKALKALLNGQIGAARSGFKAVGHDADALLFLGLTEIYAQRGPQAVAALSEAVKLRPNRADLKVPLARAQAMAGLPEGLQVLGPAAEKAKDDPHLQIVLVLAQPGTPMARAARLQAIVSADKTAAAPLDVALAWSVLARDLVGEIRLGEAEKALAAALKMPVLLPLAKQAQGELQFAKERFDDARKSFDEAVTGDPGSLDPILARVRLGIAGSMLDDAKKDLDTAATIDNGEAAKDAHLIFWQGRLAEARKDEAGAQKLYEQAMAANGDYLDPYLRDAQILRASKQDKEANAVLAKASDRASKNPEAMLTLAQAYLDAQQYGPAEEELKRATQADSTRVAANMRLGALYEKQDNLEGARAAYQAAYGANPADTDAAIALVHISLATDHVDEARKVVSDFLGQSQGSARMLAEAVLMEYRAGKLDAVKAYGDKLHAADPNSSVGLFVHGVTLDTTQPGATDEALLALKNALSMESRPEFHYAYARTLMQAKRSDEALEEYNAALHLDETYADARAAVAEYLISKQRFPEAKTELAKLTKQRPKVARYVRLLGDIALDANDPDGAFTAYQQALVLDPTDAEVYFRLGKIYQDREKPRDVIANLSKAVQLGNKDKDTWLPEAYRTLGYALKDGGKKRDAIEAFRKVLEIAPGGTDAREAANQLAILGAN
jgi:tetratricopeptide (TPR) repeat protein